jgi:hypothetical protein
LKLNDDRLDLLLIFFAAGAATTMRFTGNSLIKLGEDSDRCFRDIYCYYVPQ